MNGHSWRFEKTARLVQVKLENGEDLAHLAELDHKRWTALAAPVEGLRFDRRTLEFLDSDHDGRIRAPEVLAAVAWTLERVDSPDSLFAPDPKLADALADVVKREADLNAAAPSPEDLAALKAWEDAPKSDAAILPLGDDTAAASAAVAAVESPVDAFFTVPDDLPLVTDEPDKSLPISDRLNPKWADALRAFARVAARLLKRDSVDVLTRSDWLAAKAAVAPFRAWTAAKPVVAAAAKARLEEEEKLIRFRMHLVGFLRNFVSMADLYDPARGSVAQTGTLYLDSRAFSLCFHVADVGAHSAISGRSECCVVYLKLTREGSSATRNVCAVVTAGSVGTLYAGRNGVFYDRDGLDWDAVVTKVVESQVSLREAFWAPWRKLGETVASQIKKFVGDRQTAATAGVAKVAEAPVAKDSGNSAALASSVAALGVGVGMMGAAFAGLVGLVAGLPWWKTACAALAVVLAVSVPSVILTWFKLRRRDLGAIFNAGGWAINRPLRFSLALARTFTRRAEPIRRVPRWLIVSLLAAVLAAVGVCAMREAQVGPFAPKGSVAVRADAGVVDLSAPGGKCSVSLRGGVVLSWIPAGGSETLFRPAEMNLGPDEEWVHGGIPACWPWFGKHGEPGSRIHGFLRNFVLKVRSSRATDEFAEVVLGLVDNEATRKLWPHSFDVQLTVRVGETLRLSLKTTNRGDKPFAVTEGFHPYFLVSERDNVVVRGLNGAAYCTDRVVSPKWWVGDLPVNRALDDVFWVRDDNLLLFDSGFDRFFDLAYSGNRRVVVWNPGPEETKNRNLAKDDWRKFVCVEPATIPRDDAIEIAPGQSHSLEAVFAVMK